MLTQLDIPNTDQRVVANERATFRVKPTNAVAVFGKNATNWNELATQKPETFCTSEFLALSDEARDLLGKLDKQVSALEDYIKGGKPGFVRAVFSETHSLCDGLTSLFHKQLSSLSGRSLDDIRTILPLNQEYSVPVVSEHYGTLFRQGRWAEVLVYSLLQRELAKLAGKHLILPDHEILGVSGLWHEVDVLVVHEDLSILVAVTTGGWGRNIILRLVAQRIDCGGDLGIVIAFSPESEGGFHSVSTAHQIHTIDNFASDGPTRLSRLLERLFGD